MFKVCKLKDFKEKENCDFCFLKVEFHHGGFGNYYFVEPTKNAFNGRWKSDYLIIHDKDGSYKKALSHKIKNDCEAYVLFERTKFSIKNIYGQGGNITFTYHENLEVICCDNNMPIEELEFLFCAFLNNKYQSLDKISIALDIIKKLNFTNKEKLEFIKEIRRG